MSAYTHFDIAGVLLRLARELWRPAPPGPRSPRRLSTFCLRAMRDQGYLTRSDGKLVLPESFASADAVRTIEGKITSYLLRRAGDGA